MHYNVSLVWRSGDPYLGLVRVATTRTPDLCELYLNLVKGELHRKTI